MSLAMAFAAAGHDIVAVVGRTAESAEHGAALVGSTALTLDDGLPPADLLIISVRDGLIGSIAGALAERQPEAGAAIHVSGLTSVDALAPLAAIGISTGAFHPLQTLPTPEAGAARLRGAHIAVTADLPLREELGDLARDIGATPFLLDDDAKPLYHAAAAAAANFPLGVLSIAQDLFTEAGVPWEAARPLVEAVVANAFDLGPRAALTGPVARGDVGTVAAQLRAVRTQYPAWKVDFARFIEMLARLTGRAVEFEAVLRDEENEG